MVIDEQAIKVTTRVRDQFETHVGPWVNEFVYILTMTEHGNSLLILRVFLFYFHTVALVGLGNAYSAVFTNACWMVTFYD